MLFLLFATAGVTLSQTDPTLSIDDMAMHEADTGLAFGTGFNVRLSAASSKTVSVTLSTQSGTAIGDVDFVAGSLVLTFQPGQTSRAVIFNTKGDTLVEGTEQFFINLSNPVNATIADGQAVATIIDDDALILLTQDSSPRGAALDSVLFTREILPIVNTLNFSSDNRTRLVVFAIGLKLSAGETASAVTANAEDSQGTVRPLTVEFVGTVPNFIWLTQVVVKLNDQIPPGDAKIRISLHGETSNALLVGLKSQ
jgi:uncharacterized protein (TIGR03437 family)